jgi:DNA-directed RNA polymerase specialized sigma24 family protein
MQRLAMDARNRRFELLAMLHLGAGFRQARRLIGNTAEAEDVEHDAHLWAYRCIDTFRDGNFRVWMLTAVRNSFFGWLKRNRSGRKLFQPAPADPARPDRSQPKSRRDVVGSR